MTETPKLNELRNIGQGQISMTEFKGAMLWFKYDLNINTVDW